MEIEELRRRLEEIQNMDSIEDLTDEVLLASFPSENLREAQAGLDLGENENWARDIDMALGLERDKTQELSETVDYQRRGALEQEIESIRANRINTEEKLRTAWLQKQREQAKEARSQMKEEAKQGFIKELGEIESELQTEMQDNVTNTNRQVEVKRAQIDELNAKIAEMEEERKSILAIVAENKAVLALKSEDSQVYQVAKRESDNCVRKARRRANKIKEMNGQIENLQGEIQQLEEQGKVQGEMLQGQLKEVDEILRTIDEERKAERLQQEQEEKMWKAYRDEQKEARDREIDEAFRAKREEEQREEERVAEETKREINGYADGLNSEEPVKPEHPERTTGSNPAQPTAGQKPQTQPQQPTGQKPSTPPQPRKGSKPEKWKVESVSFTIEGGSNPVYKAIVTNGKEQREAISTEVAILDEEFDYEEIEQLTERKGIHKAETCYDKGLATLLEQIDKELGTDSLKEYQTLLKDREMIHRYPEKYEDCMKIDYDFSGLKGKTTTDMKKLQKIAKECSKKGVADYQKRPNIFQRIWRSLTSQVHLLKETSLEPNTSEEKLKMAGMIGKMVEGEEDRPYELDIHAMKDYPEFDPEVAHEQLKGDMKSIEELVHLDETIDAAKKWREEQHIETASIDPGDLPKEQQEEQEQEL